MEVAALVDAFCAGLRGERRWRNVQGVLLESFRSVGEILALQTRRLAAAEEQIAALDRWQRELERKADAAPPIHDEYEEKVAVEKALADARDKRRQRDDQRVDEQVAKAVDERAAVLAGELRIEAEQTVTTAMTDKWPSHCREVEEKLSQRLETASSTLTSKLEAQVSSQVGQIDAQLKTLAEQMKALESRQPESSPRLEERLDDLILEIEQGAARVVVKKVEAELKQLDGRLTTQLASWREQVDRGFASKVDKGEVVKLLSRKMDTLDGWKQLEEKASASRLDDVAGRLMDAVSAVQQAAASELSELRGVCDAKANAAEFEQLKFGMHDLLAVAESMQSEMSSVRALLQSRDASTTPKPTMLRNEDAPAGDTTALSSELQSVASQLDAVKRQLRGELYQARYIWKDGAPSCRQTINWNTQVLNTNSEVFTWKHGSDRIRLLVPGLYHIQASFFTTFAPTVAVRVNGEPAMRLQTSSPSSASPVPSSSSSAPSRAAGIAQRIHHSAGNVAGLTLDGVFALPSNALLSISYDIHERAQGLLNIRKL